MAKQGALTGHVGTSDDDDLLVFRVELHVVWHIALSRRHKGFDHRMAASVNVEHHRVVDNRTDIAVLGGNEGERKEAVERGHRSGIALQGGDVLQGVVEQLRIDLRLKNQDAAFSAQNLFFIFLEFLRDIALGLREGLLANPFVWHLAFIGVAHFDVVTEDVVIAYLQARNACGFALALLDLQEIVFTRR